MEHLNFWQDRTLLGISCLLYMVAFWLGITALKKPQRSQKFLVMLWAAFLLQGIGLAVRGLEVRGLPVTNTFENFQMLAWILVALAWVLRRALGLQRLNCLTAGLGALLTFVALAIPSWDDPSALTGLEGLHHSGLHVILAIFSYAVFAVLALCSLMYLMQNRALRKHYGGFARYLPSIRQLEEAQGRLITLGTEALSMAMLLGILEWQLLSQSVHLSKISGAFGMWIMSLSLLILHRSKRMVNPSFAKAALALFALAALTLWGFSQHPKADGKGSPSKIPTQNPPTSEPQP